MPDEVKSTDSTPAPKVLDLDSEDAMISAHLEEIVRLASHVVRSCGLAYHAIERACGEDAALRREWEATMLTALVNSRRAMKWHPHSARSDQSRPVLMSIEPGDDKDHSGTKIVLFDPASDGVCLSIDAAKKLAMRLLQSVAECEHQAAKAPAPTA